MNIKDSHFAQLSNIELARICSFHKRKHKTYILKNVGNQAVDVSIEFYGIFFYTMEVNGYHQLFWVTIPLIHVIFR